MRFSRKLCLSLSLCLCSLSAFAGVRVSHRLVNSNLEVFFLKDFDITRPASGPELFFVDITNDDLVAHKIILSIQVVSRRQNIVLSRGATDSFDIGPSQILMLSNRDLFSKSGPRRLVTYEIDDAAVGNLLKDILATGKLPTDVYTFELSVRDVEGQTTLTSDQFDVEISNPQKLDLVFPGRPATGRRKDCPEIFTTLPQFRWESEIKKFRVTIAEARHGEDPESVLNQEPRFVRVFTLSRDRSFNTADEFGERVEPLASTSFQYPSTGEVLTLRSGKLYYWRVEGIVETSSGPLPLQSEIYCFRMARLGDMGGGKQQLEFLLRNILGSDYEKLFGEDGELEDYLPRRVTLNGQPVTFAELVKQLRKFSANYKGYHVE
ncbi:MAG: hypothetical protein ACE5IR_14420 [bacterium]